MKDLIESIDNFLFEAEAGDYPTVTEYVSGSRRSKKRTRKEREGLIEFWINGDGMDVPNKDIRKVRDMVAQVYSDMASEWEESGLTEKQIGSRSFDVAKENNENPSLKRAFFWFGFMNSLERHTGPMWKLSPEKF